MVHRLQVTDVSITVGTFSLQNVSLSATEGDICALLGRSGSGKSTLIKTLLGLQPHRTGSITLNNENKSVSIHDSIGYSPQDHALFPNLTIHENIEAFLALRGHKASKYSNRKAALIARLQLQGHEHKRISDLSGGMRKRADLLVALMHDPPLLILDEPFAGLDISLKNFFWKLLQELANEGKIIVVSTHHVADAVRYCNTFGLIHNKRFYSSEQLLTRVHNDKHQLEQYIAHLFELGESL